MPTDDILTLDYEQTTDQFKLLADIRFKLLAFVPTVAGAATALLAGQPAGERSLAVGLLGFCVTLGIVFYELRNTQFYDAAVHRARNLEVLLELPVCSQGEPIGGLFSERPPRTPKLFGRYTIWHDLGLALVYGPAMGAWTYLVADALTALAGRRSSVLALALAVTVAALFAVEIVRISNTDKPKPSAEIARRMQELEDAHARQQAE